ncbi:nucleotide pyrophosphohydrolase [Saccharopolyspora sp. NFXS83]|uniref:nucleotide pyrophosphohydrolase n=1 Tax=Saccharopolyspora sp. NFXS83 TaxID=2993560 RepID=UPI00224AA1FC|nr:nucleotide pyrophosphohydrolase [Saccharopolyspora sp. NFXS83]MCX2730124.1 nucleotide pyrophosphohydrolase [Saccharopolyspora sp. NFXS83]
MDSIAELRARLRTFAQERDWGRFHSPKNLAMALSGEAGELIAELQWLDDASVADGLEQGALQERLADEAADVLLYLVQFTEAAGIDLVEAAHAKIDRNESRYPAHLAYGTAAKQTDLHSGPRD